METTTEETRTTNCQECGTPTSFERRDLSQPPEGEVCDQCGEWICPNCSPHCPPAPAPRIEAEATHKCVNCGAAVPCPDLDPNCNDDFTCDECHEKNQIKAEATARPWKWIGTKAKPDGYIYLGDGTSIVLVASTEPSPSDAALIVQAVNSHQALVSAVKNLLADVAIYRQELYGNRIKGPVQIHAEAALALAEGKE